MVFLSDNEIDKLNDLPALKLALKEAMYQCRDYNKVIEEAQEVQARCNRLTDVLVENLDNIKYSERY